MTAELLRGQPVSRGMKPPVALVSLLAVLALPASAPAAGPGSADPSFGTGGVTAMAIPPGGYGFYEVGVAADGRILAAGHVTDGNLHGAVVARFEPDGRVDDSFGAGGVVRLQLGEGPYPSTRVDGLAVDPDGGAVVAGSGTDQQNREELAAVRLDPAGRVRWQVRHQIGRAAGPPGPNGEGAAMSRAQAVIRQDDGKYLLGGTASTETRGGLEVALARLNPADGSLDRTFAGGAGALVEAGHGPGDASISTLLLTPSGSVVAGGGVYDLCSYRQTCPRAILQAYAADGTRDASFGAGPTGLAGIDELAAAPDGKLVATGFTHTQYTNFEHAAIARYTAAGVLDRGFAAPDGFMRMPERIKAGRGALAVQADGRILLPTSAGGRSGIARLLPDGRVDDSFGFGGVGTAGSPGGPTAGASAMALQPDGRIVVAGSLDTGEDRPLTPPETRYAVARLMAGTAHGRLDVNRTLKVRGREARVGLRCTALGATACAGRLKLTSIYGDGRRVTFGRAGYAIPSGEGATIRIALSREARRRLRRGGRRMTARLVVANQGDRVIRRRVTLTARRLK